MTNDQGRTTIALHRKRAAAAAGALGARVGDTEATTVQVIVEVHHGVVKIHQAALVDHDRHAVKLEDFVELRVDFRIEVELVLEAAAAAADDAHAQVDPAERRGALPKLGADFLL